MAPHGSSDRRRSEKSALRRAAKFLARQEQESQSSHESREDSDEDEYHPDPTGPSDSDDEYLPGFSKRSLKKKDHQRHHHCQRHIAQRASARLRTLPVTTTSTSVATPEVPFSSSL
ncbi:hypothetical protein CF319_g5758 [Tilletia indica]|nr:hypothetical protein CF319_g5758 [Tilletia indica]